MKNYRKHLDDFFREKLGNYTETPPPEVWEELEKRLDGLQPHVSGKPYRWMWHFAMVSLILLFGLSLIKKSQADNSVLATANNKTTAINNTGKANGPIQQNDVLANSANTNNVEVQKTTATVNTDESGNQIPTDSKAGTIIKPKSGHFHANGFTKSFSPASLNFKPGKGVTHKNAQNRTSNFSNSIENAYETASNTGLPLHSAVNSDESNERRNKIVKAELPPLPKKEEKTVEQTKSENKNEVAKSTHSICNKFEFGVKLGYETGMNNDAATKYVVAPYVYYKLCSKISLGIQPAVKYATINTRQLNSLSYYQIKSSNISQIGESEITTYIDGGTTYDIYKTKYNYKQTYDSVVKTNITSGSYTEAELPVMVKYMVSPKIAVYGGLNIIYSSATTITERTTTVTDIVKSVDAVNESRNIAQSLPIEQVINYSGQNTMSEYSGPIRHNTTNDIRMGVNIGATYNMNKRWLVDAMIQKNQANKDIKAGYDLNTPLSATYLRLSIGYKLSK